jgi:hypothetical protein
MFLYERVEGFNDHGMRLSYAHRALHVKKSVKLFSVLRDFRCGARAGHLALVPFTFARHV